MKNGDLVFIPASVSLFREEDVTIDYNNHSHKTKLITDIITTNKPEYAILLDLDLVDTNLINMNHSLIFWNGEYWQINKEDMYQISEITDWT